MAKTAKRGKQTKCKRRGRPSNKGGGSSTSSTEKKPQSSSSSSKPLTRKRVTENKKEDKEKDKDEPPLDTAITNETKNICNSTFCKEMTFIIDDFNHQLQKLFPVLDDQTVKKLMSFLSIFNKKFENDEKFKKDFEDAAQNILQTLQGASTKILQTGSTTFMQILGNMVSAIPGIGSIASIAKVANNITDTAAELSTSVKDASQSLRELMIKITNMSNEMQSVKEI